MINKKGILFNRIHVVDLVILLLVLVIGGSILFKGSSEAIPTFSKSELVKIQYEVTTYEYDPIYFTSMKNGDELTEDKRYLSGRILSFEIVDNLISDTDNTGTIITGPHPINKRAIFLIESTVEYKNEAYKFGSQEIRVGKPYFVNTDRISLSGVVTAIKIIKE